MWPLSDLKKCFGAISPRRRSRSTWRTTVPILVILISTQCAAARLECTIISVADGDTLTCLTAGKKQEKIRLRGIDAPERKQPYGTRSKQNLADMAYGKTATILWDKRDRWKRIIGTVWVEPADCLGCGHTLEVGRAQLASGMAWWYERYAKEQPPEERYAYQFEQTEARARSVGLWRAPLPIPPWDWRRGIR